MSWLATIVTIFEMVFSNVLGIFTTPTTSPPVPPIINQPDVSIPNSSANEKEGVTISATRTITLDSGTKLILKGSLVSFVGYDQTLHYLDGADPATFHTIGKAYVGDSRFVWYVGSMKKIETADPSTFTALNPDVNISYQRAYATDSHVVYIEDKVINNANPTTFNLLKEKNSSYYQFAKDANHVYSNGNIIENIDLKTFTILVEAYGKDCSLAPVISDSNGVFLALSIYDKVFDSYKTEWQKFRGPVDSATFVGLGDSYFKDAKHVWRGTSITTRFTPAVTREKVCEADGWG